jgi:hypothetical protein
VAALPAVSALESFADPVEVPHAGQRTAVASAMPATLTRVGVPMRRAAYPQAPADPDDALDPANDRHAASPR